MGLQSSGAGSSDRVPYGNGQLSCGNYFMKSEIRKDWLVGRWQTADEDSFVILEISKAGSRLKVRAYSKDDNEEFVVSKTKWDGKALQFETRVPSNNYRTRNRVTPMSKTKIVQELTFWETWKKMPPVKRAIPGGTRDT